MNKVIGREKAKEILNLKYPSIYKLLSYAVSNYRGYILYNKLNGKFGKNHTLFLCPHKATGDVYIFGLYFPEYIKQNKINEYIFCVVGKGDAKVAKMYNIVNVVPITQREMDDLVRFSLFVGRKLTNIKILHYRAISMHMGIVDNMRNYKSLNFNDMLLYIVFKLDQKTIKERPLFGADDDYVNKFFEERNLKKHNTIILSPYSNSIPCISSDFWGMLAERLTLEGYNVCTNSIGSNEPVIPGTTAIFFSYEQSKEFLEYAGYFVGIRSGLCDIISSFKCKKIIINQPGIKFGVGNSMEYFSLRDMGLDEEAVELEYDDTFRDRIVDFIVEEIQSN